MVTREGLSGEAENGSADGGFAVCLSGGGLRATFFHLGVLRAMRDLDLLRRVNKICSVSGGSILAAHACVHWDDYSTSGSDDQSFFASTVALAELGRRDIRGRCVRRAMLLGLLPTFRIPAQLEQHYGELLGGRSLDDLPSTGPDLHILATSLTSGALVDFGRHGVTFSGRSSHGSETFPVSSLPLARAVAASAAFPPLVSPVPLSGRDLHATASEFPNTEYLTDGGIYDNLGTHRMMELLPRGDSNTVMVISDASAAFDWRVGQRRWGPVSRNVRASSIVMSRVSQLESQLAEGPRTVSVTIGDLVTDGDLPAGSRHQPQPVDIQRACRFVRTDLDAFTMEEIQVLVRHGYECGVKSLQSYVQAMPPGALVDPAPAPWPGYVQEIPLYRAAQVMVDASDILDENAVNIEKETRQAFGGPPISDDELSRARANEEEERAEASERAKAVRRLEESATRRLRLWSASDPFSWLALLLLLAVATVVVAWVL